MSEQKMQTEQDIHELLKVRRNKLDELVANGKDPYQIMKYDVSNHTKEIKENGFGESKTQSEAFVRLHESLPTPRYTDVTSSRASFGVVRMSMALPSESKNHNITDGITSSPCFIVQPYNTMISSCTS